jgi:AraC-like DNA-binding protein
MSAFWEPGGERSAPAERLDYRLAPNAPVHLERNGYEEPMPLKVDFHEAIEVGILLSGTQNRSFQGVSYPVSAGDAWMCASWEPHGYEVTSADTAAMVVAFLPDFLGDEAIGDTSWLALFAAPPEARPRVQGEEQRRRLLQIAEDWEEEWWQRRPGWPVAVRFDLLRVLFTLSRDWAPPPFVGGRGLPGLAGLAQVRPALRLAHATLDSKVSLAQAASTCGLSRAQFCLIFRRVMGMSFGEFCVRARLGLAARLLLSSEASLRAVADQAGFADASHLHRSFLKRYGCTPGDFRQRQCARPADRAGAK